MLQTITPAEMKRVERRAMDETGVPSLVLMERAARHVAKAAEAYPGLVLALCGPGNNGGDGLAAVRILLDEQENMRAVVWLLPGRRTEECEAQKRRLLERGARVKLMELTDRAPDIPADTACVIDALFGTGLSRAPDGLAAACIERVNVSGLPVVAVDIPSGLNGLTGEASSACVRADVTVTFHKPKDGLFLRNGLDQCGRVIVGDIGISAAQDDADGLWLLTDGDALLPARKRQSHKGTYGRVLMIAGSVGMAGAAAMSALAALRTGAGLVTVACPDAVLPIVQTLCPCATCVPLAWDALLPALQKADAVAMGCGMGRTAEACALIDRVTDWLCGEHKPAVLDADALNRLAERADAPRLYDGLTLTPHPAEAARLLGWPIGKIVNDAPGAARALRQKYGASVVLKGAASVLIAQDGEALNVCGTPAMAKGGSGDALTGVLAALKAGANAYGLTGVRLLQTACALHGLAGERAAQTHGERGLLATELCEALGLVQRVEGVLERRASRSPYEALGRRVRVTVDRPLGSRHPEHHDIVYHLNYGYVADVLAGDNEWQDAYVLGPERAVEYFEGVVAAVIHRLNDNEDKWVVAPEGVRVTADEVRRHTGFVEQYFQSEIRTL